MDVPTRSLDCRMRLRTWRKLGRGGEGKKGRKVGGGMFFVRLFCAGAGSRRAPPLSKSPRGTASETSVTRCEGWATERGRGRGATNARGFPPRPGPHRVRFWCAARPRSRPLPLPTHAQQHQHTSCRPLSHSPHAQRVRLLFEQRVPFHRPRQARLHDRQHGHRRHHGQAGGGRHGCVGGRGRVGCVCLVGSRVKTRRREWATNVAHSRKRFSSGGNPRTHTLGPSHLSRSPPPPARGLGPSVRERETPSPETTAFFFVRDGPRSVRPAGGGSGA